MTQKRTDNDRADSSIAHARLRTQRITQPADSDPVEIVRSLGAVQAQDFAAAKWAVGLRTQHPSDAAVTAAFNDGQILRAHVLRPTWHFVAAEDIRWMLELTAPRVNQAAASMYRRLGLDDMQFQRSQAIFQRALEGGRSLTRPEMIEALNRAGIEMSSIDYVHLLMRAELDGVICSGPVRGKQQSYALVEERVPQTSPLDRDNALAELTVRYYRGHGPATIKDFSWWSGLTLSDVRRGLQIAAGNVTSRVVDDVEYWHAAEFEWDRLRITSLHLLPNYDEYVVGYADRNAYWHPSHDGAEMSRSNPLFNHTIVIDGRIRGTWTRKLRKSAVDVTVNLFEPVDRQTETALDGEVEKYGRFLGLSARRV
ncbi:MAG: winged helix DNA-binding domain-containing protein [Nitrolancea sp.]